MTNDTVRQELQSKITPVVLPRGNSNSASAAVARSPLPVRPPSAQPAAARIRETGGLISPKTSPTLVGFQPKDASLPDWRIKLQNAVQQRKGNRGMSGTETSKANTQLSTLEKPVVNSNVVSRTEVTMEAAANVSNPVVANAMDRIARSREAYLKSDAKAKPRVPARPFDVVSPNRDVRFTAPATTVAPPKPKLVSAQPIAEKRDTNKLPPLETQLVKEAETVEPVVKSTVSGALPADFGEINRIHIKAEPKPEEIAEATEMQDEEIEDLAPFSMRFGAGLFDLIIGGFAGMLLLSPLAFTNGNWFTSSGIVTFAAAWAICSFLYMTLCLGFFGKTMGMRLFSLELVDAIENEYPTLRQAAVNSSVFLISIGFGGAGFLATFFNEENRALHDLASGTIIVREF